MTPGPLRVKLRVRPLSRASSATPGRNGSGAGLAVGAAQGRRERRELGLGGRGSAAARAAAMPRAAAGAQPLDEREAEALGQVGGEAQHAVEGVVDARGRRGCASASGRLAVAKSARSAAVLGGEDARGRWRAPRRGRARTG